MSTLSTTLVMFLLVVWASCVEDCNGHVMGHARKLLVQKRGDHEEHDRVPYYSFGRLVLGALPKGPYGSSAPSNKGHAAPTAATTTSVDEKLIARHLAVISRILQKLLVARQRLSSLEANLLIMAALPKGTFRSSSPSTKGHADEKHIIRHFAAGVFDRILHADPSPGVGH
ncbi:hypothetical protein Cgig2_029390 [Carnegiea gigantea]|uniref:Secreted protein n=1 Tax=Carnegiea gigantea TaxID=171969 RepID=A0A9Q1QP60_9CARY|nr:hypothetical protein Cgig2_029390 [Carnegiea gigantea]